MKEPIIGECACCCFPEIPVWESSKEQDKTGETIFLCHLCRSTLAGNSALYPSIYGDSGPIMETICYVGNAILKEIKENMKRGRRPDKYR